MENTLTKTFSIMDLLLNVVTSINIISGLGMIFMMKTSFVLALFILLSGVLIGLFIIIRESQFSRASHFITENRITYNKQRQSVFIDMEKEKEWMFLKLATKYPQMSCIRLKKLINKHYQIVSLNESNRDNTTI